MSEDLDIVLTPTEVAALAKVSLKTVYRAIRSGTLNASVIGSGRHYWITRASFWRWMNGSVVELEPRNTPLIEAGTPPAGSVAALNAIERDAA